MRRILVVDDDPTIRELLALWLEDHGWSVTTAANGAEALNEMRHRAHSLVLLDLMMPVLDGWSLLAERSRDEVLRTIPVVAMSAGGRHALDRALSMGADGCLPKPFELDSVIPTLELAAAAIDLLPGHPGSRR